MEMETEIKRKPTFFGVFLVVAIAGCMVCILPLTRSFIVMFTERFVLGRSLRGLQKWNEALVHIMFFFATIFTIWLAAWYTRQGRIVTADIIRRCKEVFSQPKAKVFLLALFIMYLICFIGIIRANYDYNDDVRRLYSGHKSWVGWSRYVSETLVVFLHTNFFINDISPISQLWAVVVLVVTSYILAYIVTDGHITKLALIASTFVGISPFFMENFSFKFDSPYMSLAILFGILPFLFIHNWKNYIVMSFISLVLVCTSYQAANSIYIILCMFMTYRMWSQKKDAKEIAIYVGISIACFVVALVFFLIFMMNTVNGGAANSRGDISFGNGMLQSMLRNEKAYIHAIFSGYGNLWIKICTLAAVILFPFSAMRQSMRGKLATFCVSSVLLVLLFLFSFGVYLVLEQALISPRAFLGFDVLLAVSAIFVVAPLQEQNIVFRKMAGTVVVLLFYGLLINTTVTGSLYNKQKEYEHFRYGMLLYDLSTIVDPSAHNSIYIGGVTGPAGKTRMERKNYNMLMQGYSTMGMQYLVWNWNMDFEFLSESDLDELDLQPELKRQLTELPLIKDTYYHTIYGNNNQYYVYLKNPQVRE